MSLPSVPSYYGCLVGVYQRGWYRAWSVTTAAVAGCSPCGAENPSRYPLREHPIWQMLG